MPTLTINTNLPLSAFPDNFIKDVSSLAATLLQKPEKFICVHLCHTQAMSFGGSGDPCMAAVLSSIGSVSENNNRETAAQLMKLIEKETKIPMDRMYLKFEDVERHMMAWDGVLFKK